MKNSKETIKELHEEKKELDHKIYKLGQMLERPTGNITARQFDLMRFQRGAMKKYSQALKDRIDDLNEE